MNSSKAFNILLKYSKFLQDVIEAYKRALGIEAEIILTEAEKRNIIERHAMRIDAVVYTDSCIWLLEVKDRVRKSAIGQLLVYKEWFEKNYRPVLPIRLAIVAAVDDVMVRAVAEKLGIQVFLV